MGLGTLDSRFTVNGTPIYAPSESGVQYDHESIVISDSGRTEDGVMHIRWVRTDIHKVSMTWKRLTGDEVHYLKDLMQGKVFSFKFWDNGSHTIEGYCPKVNYTLVGSATHQGEGGVYINISANVTEM